MYAIWQTHLSEHEAAKLASEWNNTWNLDEKMEKRRKMMNTINPKTAQLSVKAVQWVQPSVKKICERGKFWALGETRSSATRRRHNRPITRHPYKPYIAKNYTLTGLLYVNDSVSLASVNLAKLPPKTTVLGEMTCNDGYCSV